jgi:hypothetical protein
MDWEFWKYFAAGVVSASVFVADIVDLVCAGKKVFETI